MRVILLTSSGNRSGGSRQALYLAQGLENRGHNVVFIIPRKATLRKLAPDWPGWSPVNEKESVRYFYKITVETSKENVLNFFLVPEDTEQNGDKIPDLKAETLKKNKTYIDFAKKINQDTYPAYLIYKSTSELTPPTGLPLFEHLQNLIDNGDASYVATSELVVTPLKKKKSKRRKSQKISAATVVIAVVAAAAVGIVAFAIGANTGSNSGITASYNGQELGADGMILPEQSEFDKNAELLTVTIDRSYSAVPKEDWQIRGEIVNGTAAITLPDFDRNDFFSHVYGHTWGFTTDPNGGTKIEYYGGETYEFTEPVKLYRVLVKYGGGSGSKDDPYLINWYDQLSLMSEEKARGYFRQNDDIAFPENAVHTPIDTVNELKLSPDSERFEYDGGGYSISGLNAPLFGKVSGSLLQNINVTDSAINTLEYKNHGFIVAEAYNYRYESGGATYETGETVIRNCTVSHSAIRLQYPTVDSEGNPLPQTVPAETEPLPPDVIINEETPYVPQPQKNAEYALGGISGLGGEIENCYVTDVGIYTNISEYFLYAGGISGKPANVRNCGVVFLSIEGNVFNAGGIAGSGGGSRLHSADGGGLPEYYGGNIQGCFVRLFNGYSELSAGGIVGEGSTNAANPIVSNCYAASLDLKPGAYEDEERSVLVKAGFSGGIIGSDGNESNGHLMMNNVSAAEYGVIGSANASAFDGTVRLAPAHAFYQAGILDVINRNTVHPNTPDVIFTGSFTFAPDGRNSDDGGDYALPDGIGELMLKIYESEEMEAAQ